MHADGLPCRPHPVETPTTRTSRAPWGSLPLPGPLPSSQAPDSRPQPSAAPEYRRNETTGTWSHLSGSHSVSRSQDPPVVASGRRSSVFSLLSNTTRNPRDPLRAPAPTRPGFRFQPGGVGLLGVFQDDSGGHFPFISGEFLGARWRGHRVVCVAG